MSLDSVQFNIRGTNEPLDKAILNQGDTLPVLARIPTTSLSTDPLPVAKLVAIDNINPQLANVVIPAKSFTVTLNSTLTTLDLSLILAPADTEDLVLNSTLGQLLGLQSNEFRYYQPARRFYWEVQLTANQLNHSWQGSFIVKTDFYKVNSSGTMPGVI